ncbi:MAG: YgiQ family radical SAM protein [Deltaproteobacteria bacterium]|nr:YgiQ family radical SAM protein [Deltaproteobacteria bacterium]
MDFLPVTKEEIVKKGWKELDIVIITGDAYVDHPAFGTAVIGRVLEEKGYRVGIISMPDWRDPSSVTLLGRPRLFFGVTSGAVDSMLSKYTAFKRFRSNDPYRPGDSKFDRPDRAVITYCNHIKNNFKDVPVILGGIESSMRRIAHFDFWSNRVRRSIIEDARADILVYGMGEPQIVEIAGRISGGEGLMNIPGTIILSKEAPPDAVMLPSEEDSINDIESFLELYRLFFRNQHKVLAQKTAKRYIVHYPPPHTDTGVLDRVFALPFMNLPHPSYRETIPAYEMIKNSIISHRGCFSGCSFCSLSLHQGKRIVSRSSNSIITEIKNLTKNPEFNGHITDIGGPSANMYSFGCAVNYRCNRESCLSPSICPKIRFNTAKWISLLDDAASVKGVKKVSIGSGIRYDLFMKDPDSRPLLKKLVNSFISGQLKIAPEHTSERVLRAMRKQPIFNLREFVRLFKDYTDNAGKKQYLIPYLMSCHPGCEYRDMKDAKKDIQAIFNFIPDQVQAFIPLPMTLSSVIYYTGIDPITNESFPVTKDIAERRKQHNLFFE